MNGAIKLAIEGIMTAMEGEVNPHNIEIGIVTRKESFKKIDPDDVEKLLNKALTTSKQTVKTKKGTGKKKK